MAEQVSFESLPPEDMVERMRVHGQLLTGYTLALAERAGLDPLEAADLFILPCLEGVPAPHQIGRGQLRHWIGLEAAAMEAVHGWVRVEGTEDRWALVISVADDLAALRLWNVSPTYWAAWMAGHVRRVAARHGIVATVSLEGEELRFSFVVA